MMSKEVEKAISKIDVINPVRELKSIHPSEGKPESADKIGINIRICDAAQFDMRVNSETESDRKAMIKSLAKITHFKRLPPITRTVFEEIARIGDEQPNFHKVTDLILDTLYAQCLSGMPATLPPILMYGSAGVGKTRYVKRITKALGLVYCDIPLSGNSDAFKVTGLSRYWSSAGPGMVASTLVKSDVANPIFLLDEIDKSHKSENGDPLSRMLLLLEKETSAVFKDDFIDVPIDASYASYFATANCIDELPLPLLSRIICVHIEPLDYQGRCKLVKNVYGELREQEGYGAFFSEALPQELVNILADCEWLSGRELKREMMQSMQRACRQAPIGKKPDNSLSLKSEYLHLPEKTKVAKPMGFVI